jgi:hypothetical protein
VTRTQTQLPTEVYLRAKRLCKEREISLAELARRGIEHFLNVYAPEGTPKKWSPPKPKSLGFRHLSDDELKSIAQGYDHESLAQSASIK